MDTKRGTGAGAVVLSVLLMLFPGAGAAQVVEGTPRLDFTGRVQVQLNTTSVDGEDLGVEAPFAPAAAAFEMRRVRLGAKYAFADWMTGTVEGDFSGTGARLTDGFVDVAVAHPLAVRAGQFKKPFGVIELESSGSIRTVERGLRIRGVEAVMGVPGEAQWLLDESGYLGRQIGVMLHGGRGALGYAVGAFNGEGANAADANGSKAWAGRVTYGVREPLVVGAAVSRQPSGLFADGEEVRGTAWALDATWGDLRRPGLHAKAEWVLGDNLALAAAEPPTMTGAHAVVAWYLPRSGRVEGLEPVFRLSWADPDVDTEADAGLLLTPGANVYFHGRNRLMLNGDVYLPGQEGLDPEFAVVAQVQVAF